MAQQSHTQDWAEMKEQLENSIERFKQLMSEPGPIKTTLDTLEKKFDLKFDEESKQSSLELKKNPADQDPAAVAQVKEGALKQQLLNSLPEPLKTILENKNLDLKKLKKILLSCPSNSKLSVKF